MNRWSDLAIYNAECSRGIVHTIEYVENMRLEQARFDAEQETKMRALGAVPVEGGSWLLIPESLCWRGEQ